MANSYCHRKRKKVTRRWKKLTDYQGKLIFEIFSKTFGLGLKNKVIQLVVIRILGIMCLLDVQQSLSSLSAP